MPILDRASFDVRLLASVWLVAPGPPESSLAVSEDQQVQVEWQNGAAEVEGAGAGEGRKAATTPVRIFIFVMHVLVMVECLCEEGFGGERGEGLRLRFLRKIVNPLLLIEKCLGFMTCRLCGPLDSNVCLAKSSAVNA